MSRRKIIIVSVNLILICLFCFTYGAYALGRYEIETVEFWIPAPNGNSLYGRIVQPQIDRYPNQVFPAVITVPGGTGPGAPLADAPGYRDLAARGFVVVNFNAEGRGSDRPGDWRSEGDEDCNGFTHQDDVKAVVEYAAGLRNVDSNNIGVQTSSLGIAMGAGALGRYAELPVKYLIDGEGPHDSRVVTFYDAGREQAVCGHWSLVTDPSPENEAWWSEREAVRHVGRFAGYYLRMQAECDHAQPCGYYRHALEMINAATSVAYGGGGVALWTRMNGNDIGNPINAVYPVKDPEQYPMWIPGRMPPPLTTQYIEEVARLVKGRPSPDSPFGFHPAHIAGELPAYSDALNIGISWERDGNAPYLFWALVDPEKTGDPAKFQWKGSDPPFDYDQLFKARDAGLNTLMNIDVEPGFADLGYRRPDSWVPVDESAYRSFVKAAVARYAFIRHWQVGNEPNLGPVRTRSGFADLQRITYEAIKEADPDSKVLIGGAGGNMSTLDAGDQYYEPILAALDGRYMDIFDFHFYGDAKGGTTCDDRSCLLGYRSVKESYDYFRDLLNRNGFSSTPIWITEMGTFSGTIRGGPRTQTQTEAEQARDLLKRWVYPISVGVQKVFWAFGLMEGFGPWDDDFFDHTGLIYGGQDRLHERGQRKLGYFTFNLMTNKLDGALFDRELLGLPANVYGYVFKKDGDRSVYVLWYDYYRDTAGSREVTLTGLRGDRVQITDSVSDEDGNFETSIKAVVDGSVAITLRENPVFVE
ncbi:MAG: hypothetical protein HY232_12465 [Acidobacteria bacterium]|nr:hypothetical protein [Acidobacteriota bacterium]